MSLCKLQTYVTEVVDNKQISARDPCKFKWISVRVYYDTHLIDFCYTPEYTGSMQDVPQLLNDMLSSSDQSMKEIVTGKRVERRNYTTRLLGCTVRSESIRIDLHKANMDCNARTKGYRKNNDFIQVYGDPALNEVKNICII